VATFERVTRPSIENGQYAPGLRFGDPRVAALCASLVGFCHVVAGFTNRQLVERVCSLGDKPYHSRQATYDLRRLRRKGLIRRIEHTQRYELTPLGRRVAVLFTKGHGRMLTGGLSLMDPQLPDHVGRRSPLASAWKNLETAIDEFTAEALAAA